MGVKSISSFDPFCRRQRLFIDFETRTPIFLNDNEIDDYKLREDGLVTTIGQLAFFRWAILNEVIDFCFNNKKEIDEEMEKMDKKKKNTKVQKDDTMVTIYNNVDTISIEKVNENEPVDQNQEEQETAFSKF